MVTTSEHVINSTTRIQLEIDSLKIIKSNSITAGNLRKGSFSRNLSKALLTSNMNNKFLKHLNTFFVVLPMTLIMAFVAISINYGFNEGWIYRLFSSWIVMAPVAYATAFFIIPRARILTERVASRRPKIK